MHSATNKPPDLTDALNNRVEPQSVDIVTALDVFVYFGDLSNVIAAVARVLRPGGLFAMTTESLERAAHPKTGEPLSEEVRRSKWHLQGGKRFAHSRAYLLEVLRDHGFSSAVGGDGCGAYFEHQERPMRKERKALVFGHFIVTQRT